MYPRCFYCLINMLPMPKSPSSITAASDTSGIWGAANEAVGWIKYLKILNNPPLNFEQKQAGDRVAHKVHIYVCVCPLVRIETPLSRKWVCPVHPSGTKAGGGHTWLRVRGSQLRRLEKKPSTLSTAVCGVALRRRGGSTSPPPPLR